jgi:hypothetical protein
MVHRAFCQASPLPLLPSGLYRPRGCTARPCPPPCQPKIASNSATVAPLFAARDAPILRTPCADFSTPARCRFLHQWPAVLTADEGAVSAGASLEDFTKGGQDRNRDGHAGLFGPDRRHAVADMLAPKAHRIAATQPGIEQHAQPNALFGADRAMSLVSLQIVLGPYRKPGRLPPPRIFYAGRRIRLDVASIDRPAKKDRAPRPGNCGLAPACPPCARVTDPSVKRHPLIGGNLNHMW